MKYVVKARDLKWDGQRLAQGETFSPDTDRLKKRAHVLTLTKPPAVELVEEGAPVRTVATVRPRTAAPPPPPEKRAYRTRRLKAK